MTDLLSPGLGRSSRLEHVLSALLSTAPELEAAAVVSFDGLPMASALPAGMDEDRVAAMSAALLSLGDRAAQGLGRGDLSQVYVEGENGTVFLVSADDEAVLVAVAARRAKIGMMLFEVRRAAEAVAAALVADDLDSGYDPYAPLAPLDEVDPAPEAAPAEQTPAADPFDGYPPVAETVADDAPAVEVADNARHAAPAGSLPLVPPPNYAAPAAQSASGGPVMVPSGSSLAPDGLSWPQIPSTSDNGWG